MNLQESIRRILREETNFMLAIRRRVPHEDLEREFEESLDMASNMFFNLIKNSGDPMSLKRFVEVTISILIDGIHYELYSTIPGDVQWYGDAKKSLEEYYKDRIKVRYERLISELYMNLQESIKKVLREETKPKLFLRRRFTQEELDELVFNLEYTFNTFNRYQMDQKHREDVIDAEVNEFIVNSRYYSDFMDLDDQKYWEIYNQYRNPLIDYLKSKLSMVDNVKQELDEYTRTLKNARRHGTKLRFPKSAIKANPQRFRKYTRDSIQESDPKVGTGKKPEGYIRRILRESKFFHRRIELDDVKERLPINAQQVYYETESYEQFKYELTLKAVEAIMWDYYGIGWDELPEQEEIEFVTEASNILEDEIKELYNIYHKK